MCLDILESDPPNLDETGFGWKVLRKEGSYYTSVAQFGYKYIPNEWTYARTHFVRYLAGFYRSPYLEVEFLPKNICCYLGGIYIYLRTVDWSSIHCASTDLIKRVEYQGVLARGYQNGKKVLVVHAIRVIN